MWSRNDRQRRIALHALVSLAACSATIHVYAQEAREVWLDDIEEIRRAAVDALDRMDADLIRLQESWKADVVGKEALLLAARQNLIVDAPAIDNYCDTIALEDIQIWRQLDDAVTNLEDGLRAQEEAGALNAQMIENWTSHFIWQAHQIVMQRAEVHWRSHLHAAGFGNADVPGRAMVVAAEVQNELNALAEPVQAAMDEIGARLDSGEIDFGGFVQGMGQIRKDAQGPIDAILADERWRTRLDGIKGSLDAARLEHANLVAEWSKAVETSLTAGPPQWRANEIERVRLDVNAWTDEALNQLWSESDPWAFDRTVKVAPYTLWNVLLQDQAGGDVVVALGEPLAFAKPVGELAARGNGPAPGDLPQPLKAGPPPSPIVRICGVRVVAQTSHESPDGATRTMCVYGFGLLNHANGAEPLTENDNGVSYEILGTRAGSYGISAEEPLRSLWQSGIDATVKGMPPSDATAFRIMDAVMVKATIAPGTMPGLRSFKIGDAEGTWLLDAAAASARIEFVRQIPWRTPDIVDRPEEFFIYDSMSVQVETSVPLEVDELSLVVLRNRQPITFAGDVAAICPTGEAGIVIAHRLEGFPTIYRTRSLFVDEAGRPTPPDRLEDLEIATAATHGDTFWSTTDGLLFAAPVADSVAILQSPDRIKTVDGKGMLFTEAIRDASILDGLQLTSLDVNDEDVVDAVWHWYPVHLKIHEIQFSCAEHAAMLLLKRTFLRMAEDYLAQLEAIVSNDASIRGHIPDMTAQMQAGVTAASAEGDMRLFPLGQHAVAFPMNTVGVPRDILTEYGMYRWREGFGTTALFNAFSPEGERFFKNRADFDQWQFDCTREALRFQIDGTKAAIEYARSCDDDDVEDLLEFTGRGFDPVVERIMPRLVEFKADPTTGRFRWVPHQRGRELVLDLSRKLFENEIAASGARASQEVLLAVVTGATAIVGLGGSIVAKAILAATSAISIGYAGADIANLQMSKSEVQFAADATEIIGRDRLKVDLRDRDVSATPYVTLALSVFGLRCDIADLVRGVRLSAAQKVVAGALGDVERRGMEGWWDLSADQQTMAFALFTEAEAARAAGKALTPAQEAAERAARRIDQDFAVRHPYGWPYDDMAFDTPPAGVPAHQPLPPRPTDPPPPPGSSTADLPPGGADETTKPPDALPDLPTQPEVAGRRYLPRSAIPDHMPLPGYTIIDPGTGQKLVVGEPIGRGVYATTYELLDDTGAPTGQVIKFYRTPFEESARQYAERLSDMDIALREAKTLAPWDDTPLPEVIDRVMHGQKLIREANIPNLGMMELDTPLGLAGRNHDPPFIVQNILPDDGSVSLFNPDGLSSPSPAQQRAIAVLYKKLADAGLIWQDGHITNIFFRKTGNADELVAGIFDPDMIARYLEDIANERFRQIIHEAMTMGYHKRIGSNEVLFDLVNQTPTPDVARRFTTSVNEYMAKMLERHTFVFFREFSEAQQIATRQPGEFVNGLIDASIALEVFGDLNQWVRKPVAIRETVPGGGGN